ncbi:EG45-like domain containing protein [Momordica charantia]|uniref:EG45-like domain containing protein n=1 Tax=Momordica charantia TaxID=3673 RepID=A0A6J1BR20_MOMCH|nr:EG45-like domain containing protein [Momordica charantia]
MSKPVFFSLIFVASLFHLSHGDVGSATFYNPPYSPTACGGGDLSQFPTNNLFAAAGEGIWDNGAACGRNYQVRCLSATVPKACMPDQIIQITIVDRAATAVSKAASGGRTMVLSTTAYKSIVQGSTSFVNIEYREV